MAHFAQLDENNKVITVNVIGNDDILDENGNESEAIGIAFCENLWGGRWIQTSYNKNFRLNYAGVGMTYDAELNAFLYEKPHASWILNETTGDWEAPIPLPDIINGYAWDEASLQWNLVKDNSNNGEE
jgi:hypothetical protein